MRVGNGFKYVETESEEVLQATEWHVDSYVYRDVEGFGAIRYWQMKLGYKLYCDGYVPWVGY